MDPAKAERKVQKWNGWWEEHQYKPNAAKHYETYQRQMERLGQTPVPYNGSMPATTAPGDDRDDHGRRRGKRKD